MVNRNNKFLLFIIAFILFSIYCFVFSDSGILERMKLQKEIEYIQLTIIQKQAEIKKFKELNRADSLDNLLVRESINAGYIPQGAKAFEFKDTRFHNQQVQSLMPTRSEKFALYIKYGRILWLTFSLLIIIGMLLYYKHKNRL